jgi:hypothetical protein
MDMPVRRRADSPIDNIKLATEIAGTLSTPEKMPAYGYGLPAQACKRGAILRKNFTSPCHKCYAFRGHYQYDNVKAAQQKRLASIIDPRWEDAMVTLIGRACSFVPHFRWHDSGDVQDNEHIRKIVNIAERLEWVKFWLPTQEHAMVRRVMRRYSIPRNLVIRASCSTKAPIGAWRRPVEFENTSSVVGRSYKPMWQDLVESNNKDVYYCPSPLQMNKCQQCRACWNPTVKHVVYLEH